MFEKKFLSPKELSEYIGVKESSLAVWRTNKTYPLPYIKVGGLIRYNKEAVDQWLESRSRNTEGIQKHGKSDKMEKNHD